MKPHKIIKVIRETPDVVTLRFVDADGQHANFIPGQFVTISFPDLDVAEGKAYSLSSLPDDSFLAVTVKKIGQYSSRLHELKSGNEMLVSEPYGFLNPQFDMPIVCIAAGVGISPLLSIIRDTLKRDSRRDVRLWYSNRTCEDIVFAKELDKLQTKHQNFSIKHFITREKVTGNYENGRIDIAKILSAEKLDPATFFLVCGAESFVGAMWHALVDNGISKSKIATETFF
jgi:ferredoxin-NADP reductase